MQRIGLRLGWLAWFGALTLASAGGYAASALSDHSMLAVGYAVAGIALGAVLMYENSRSRWTSWIAVGAFLAGFVLTRAG